MSSIELLNSQAEACYLLAVIGMDWLQILINLGLIKHHVLDPTINTDSRQNYCLGG